MTETPTEILRRTIRESGNSFNSIAKATGVPQPTISRFMNGAELRSNTFDVLTAHLGLTICKAKSDRRKK